MDQTYWKYFLSIEKNFIRTTQYVEVESSNFKTYSIEYAKLLLTTSSEIDVVCKLLCKLIGGKVNNMDDYRKCILTRFPKITTTEINYDGEKFKLKPWLKWESNANPDWWQSHNKVKHERSDFFHKANLENVLHSIAGLEVINLYYYQLKHNCLPEINPEIFGDSYFGGYWQTNPEKILPDYL